MGQGNPDVWYKHFDDSTKREYFEIKDYKIKVPGKEGENGMMMDLEDMSTTQRAEFNRIKDVMKTEKKSKCDGACCIGPVAEIVASNPKSHLHEQLKNEKCQCAKEKVECSDECGCDKDKCRNR